MEDNYRLNILIVDDDDEQLNKWQEILTSPTHNIIRANSGYEAMSIVIREEVQLVITDIDMPVQNGPQMNGFELIKHIKSNARYKDVHVIFTVDDHESIDDIVHGLEDGAIDYLMEPLHPELTRAKIEIFEKLYYKEHLLRIEREKSEQLLRNILPHHTIDELKRTGKSTARHYDSVTVLFADFVNFTAIADKKHAEYIVDKLNHYFSEFDDITSEFFMEKIKTIGDAYMAASGVPIRNKFSALFTCLAALRLIEYIQAEVEMQLSEKWQIRIGINTGPVVAGIVGKTKYQYDIWGDTVNTASRLENASEAGKINISHHTYELVKDYLVCTYRGEMQVKGKGMVEMYYVEGIKPEYSNHMDSFRPNEKLMQLLHQY